MDSVSSSDKKPMKRSATTPPPPPPTLMLKDYLLDDMSSCSSNGFRSVPRRQCCSNVKFILEFDLKKTKSNIPTSPFRRAVINAVKILPFYKRRSLLSRSFWKKSDSDKDINFLKSFKCLNDNSLSVSQPSPAAAAVTAGGRKGKSLSDSSISVFTADNLQSSSCNSESSCDNNDVVLTEISPEIKPVGKIVAVKLGKYDSSASSTGNSKEEWVNINNNLEETKEQFSPISVLDFPFDNQDDVSWPFRRNSPILEGEKLKISEKFKIFKSLSKLEPVNLNNQFATIEVSSNNKNNVVRAEELVEVVKNACQSSRVGCKMDGLLVDFFNERIELSKKFERDEAIRVAENWMNGQPDEVFLGWEVEDNRKVYIKYMENFGGKFDEEIEETAKEIEDEIFSCLLDELLF